jgi:putative tryptophan/tyrosine transport system substrate-binding protein
MAVCGTGAAVGGGDQILGATSAAKFKPQVDAFLKGFSKAGYITGRNVTIEYRWAEDRYERLPALAAELAARRVEMDLASSPPAAVTAKAAMGASDERGP